jgi:hypothetical protein
MRAASAVVAAFAVACTFDAPGLGGDGGGPGVGPGEVAGSSSDPTRPVDPTTGTGDDTGGTMGATGDTRADTTTEAVDAGTESGVDDTGATSTGGLDTGTSAPDPDTGDPPGSTGVDPPDPPACNAYKQVLRVADAEVVPPMEKVMSGQVEEGIVAYSEANELGSVRFQFDAPCEGEYAVWGRVLDQYPGPTGNGPDTFYFRKDGDFEQIWYYGCQFADDETGYQWKRIAAKIPAFPCDTAEDWRPVLSAGPHTITLRNREGIYYYDNKGEVAAVARIIVTNVPGFVPTSE